MMLHGRACWAGRLCCAGQADWLGCQRRRCAFLRITRVFCVLTMALPVLSPSDAKAKKSADAKKSKSTARHNQGGAKQTYARPSSKGAKGKAVTGRGK
jgi:hypothetical protein